MSTEVEVRFCTSPAADRHPLPALAGLVGVVADESGDGLRIEGFRVFDAETIQPIHDVRDGLAAGEVLAAIEPWDTPDHRISIRSELAVATASASGVPTEPLLVPVWIESRGGLRRGRTGDWWTDGDAGVSLGSVTPFVYAEAEDGSLVDRPDVRLNVARLQSLVRAAIGALRPEVARVQTDSGEPFPFNAHLAYFASPDAARRDVDLIRTLFTDGQRVLELPPLGLVGGDLRAFVFHEWRTSERRADLQRELAEAVASSPSGPSDEAVERALADWSAPQRPKAAGTIVSAGEALLNGFVDRFYLAMLAPD
jgi:hypothetical protein